MAKSAADTDTPELRSAFIAQLRDVKVQKSGNGDDVTFTGSAVVYNTWSEPLWTPIGSFKERILAGALDDVLEDGPDVRLLINHDPSQVIARTKSGTLELTNDADALRVWARLDMTDPDVQRLTSKMRRGDIDQMSFAFMFDEEDGAEDRWYEDDDSGEILRDVIRVSDLLDVSPVTYPAYESTSAAIREIRSAELRAAIDAGKITLPEVIRLDALPAAQPETDAAGTATIAPAGTDPVDGETSIRAQAETDPAVEETDALAELRARARGTAQGARETYLRLLKEMLQ